MTTYLPLSDLAFQEIQLAVAIGQGVPRCRVCAQPSYGYVCPQRSCQLAYRRRWRAAARRKRFGWVAVAAGAVIGVLLIAAGVAAYLGVTG